MQYSCAASCIFCKEPNTFNSFECPWKQSIVFSVKMCFIRYYVPKYMTIRLVWLLLNYPLLSTKECLQALHCNSYYQIHEHGLCLSRNYTLHWSMQKSKILLKDYPRSNFTTNPTLCRHPTLHFKTYETILYFFSVSCILDTIQPLRCTGKSKKT